MRLWSKLLACISIFILSACATEQWISPATPRGHLCVEECHLTEQRCIGGQQMAIANCANTVQTELHAYNDPNMYAEMACADGAYDGEAGTQCQRYYRQCFLACGGTIKNR